MLSQTCGLSGQATNILKELCVDPKNTTYVISGRSVEIMKDKFKMINNLGIAPDNGYYYAWNKTQQNLEFSKLTEIKDWGWKDAVIDIMQTYKERIDGSFIHIKDSSVSWFYRDVDTDFGIKEANELVSHLQALLQYLPLVVQQEKEYVQVCPKGVNKGAFVRKLLRNVESKKGKLDFILCIGDDNPDEEMFKAIKEFPKDQLVEKNTFCVTVGQKTSLADFYVNDYNEVVNTLIDIVLPSIEVINIA